MTNWLVVLNWNGREDTLALLSDLASANLPDTTLLVVDNGSSDGTLDAVHEGFPDVRTLQTGDNLGYAGGNNRGIELALSEGAQVVGVLNNDTRVPVGFWPPLVAAARSGDVAVSPDIRYAGDVDRSWFFGGRAAAHEGLARHLQPNEQPSRDRQHLTETLTGCCLVATAATWRRVGLFDEGLFLVFEDADWSLRARQRAVTLLLEPASRIEHKVSRSFIGQQDGAGLYYYCRNGAIFASRWLGPAGTVHFVFKVLTDGFREVRRSGASRFRPLAVRVLGLLAAATGQRGPAGPWVGRVSSRGRQ